MRLGRHDQLGRETQGLVGVDQRDAPISGGSPVSRDAPVVALARLSPTNGDRQHCHQNSQTRCQKKWTVHYLQELPCHA